MTAEAPPLIGMSEVRQRPYSVFVVGEHVGTVWAPDRATAVSRASEWLPLWHLRDALRTLLVKRRTA